MIDTNNVNISAEFNELKRLYLSQKEELQRIKQQNKQLQKDNEELAYELKIQTKQNKDFKEHVKSQDLMFQQTSDYMVEVIEQTEMQNREIAQKNEELELKNQEIEEQRVSLEHVLHKLKESHHEIHEQRAKLEVTVKALKKNKEKLSSQKQIVERALKKLEEAYSDIKSSINYAKRIQEAMLPDRNRLANYFTEHALVYKPKDIVSGDFYWFTQLENGKIIVVAADCTGHGVPGALMSMIGINLLDDIIIRKSITSPNEILEALDQGIRYLLNQGQNSTRDGMDIAICSIQKEEKILEFAGAHNPMLLIQNGEATLVRGDRTGVGGYENPYVKKYTKHQFSIEEDTRFYIYSDGFQDQFGGPNGRKFMSKNFRNLLVENHQLPMQTQETILYQTSKDWTQAQKQLDDILILGIKI